MIDREKIINALEQCINGCDDECPYEYGGAVTLEYCRDDLMRDALELLKEQEPVTWSYKYNCFTCSNCGLDIVDEVYYMINKPINFCPTCGRKVKWDETN